MASTTKFNGNVIDFEASSSRHCSYPIEVGLVLGNGDCYSALIQPEYGWNDWCHEAEAIHGLSRFCVEHRGKSAVEVCSELNEICRGQTLFTDCWVLDSMWLKRLFDTTAMTPTFSCSPIEYFVDDAALVNWYSRKKRTAKRLKLAEHRALNDAVIIAETLENMMSVSADSSVTHLHSQEDLAANAEQHNTMISAA